MKNLKIKNSMPIQEDFWGNGAIYHGYAGMPDDANRVYTEEQCIIEAKRATDMKLKIARTMYKWWAWDKDTNTWDWDNAIMTPFYKWLQRMKDGNVTVALNAGWCNPGDVNSTWWNAPSPFVVEGDWAASVQNYANWVSESLYQLVELRGFTNIKILTLFTEPQRWSGTCPAEGMTPYDTWLQSTRAVHDTLVRDGRRDLVKLMGPNEGSTVTSDMVKWVVEHGAADYIDIFSSHTYQFTPAFKRSLINDGKGAVTMSIPGGRFAQITSLKPNTDYVATFDLYLENKCAEGEKIEGTIHCGAYTDDGRADMHKPSGQGGGPKPPVNADSYIDVDPTILSDKEYKTVTIKFNSGDTTSAAFGVFDDITTPHSLVCNNLSLCEEGSDVSIVPNCDFSEYLKHWKCICAGGTVDSYDDWCTWNKTGLQYLPEGKQFCFDEYNVTYDRDNSHLEHGAEICAAAVAFMNCGSQSSLLWTVFDQQWPNNHTYNNDSFVDGDHRCGVMPVINRTLVPHLSYYAFTLISKYVSGEGTKVYEGEGNDCLCTTMSVSPEGEITVVVVNNKEIPDEFEISFEKALPGVKFNRHSFDPATCIPDENATIIGTDLVTQPVTETLSDKIGAYSVTVYTTMAD